MAYEDERDFQQSQSEPRVDDAQPSPPDDAPRVGRREIGRFALATGGLLALESALPRTWAKPVVEVGYLPAHAQASSGGSGSTIRIRELPSGSNGSGNTGPTTAPSPLDGGVGDGGVGDGGVGEGGVSEGGVGEGGVPPDSSVGREGGVRGAGSFPDLDSDPGAAYDCSTAPLTLYSPVPQVQQVTAHSAVVTWQAMFAHTYRVTVTNLATNESTTQTVAGGAIIIEGLEPCTQYSVDLEALLCGTTGYTQYTSFTTRMDPTVAPDGARVVQLYCDGAYIEWNSVPCAGDYEVEIRDAGGNWVPLSSYGNYPQAWASNLCPDTSYTVRIRAVGYGGEVGRYTLLEFRTLPASLDCPSNSESHHGQCGPQSGGQLID